MKGRKTAVLKNLPFLDWLLHWMELAGWWHTGEEAPFLWASVIATGLYGLQTHRAVLPLVTHRLS